jgi:predicted DNA-binding protein YlxM (UPF0122 family)
MDNNDTITIEQDVINDKKTGWGFFNEEISWFLLNFFQNQLTPEEKLIFYGYYVNGLSLEEISDRIYSREEIKKFTHEKESKKDDFINIKPVTHQMISLKLEAINKKLRDSWKYADRWR